MAMFPPVPESMIEDGYADFAARWNPILDVFDEVGVRFAHEVPPSEIAYDYWTTVRTMEAIGNREAFGLNWDRATSCGRTSTRSASSGTSRTGSTTSTARTRRSRWQRPQRRMGSACPGPNRGAAGLRVHRARRRPVEACFRMLNTIGYDEPDSVEWEDAGMDRLVGRPRRSS